MIDTRGLPDAISIKSFQQFRSKEMQFWIWLENFDRKLDTYGNSYKQFPESISGSLMKIIGLMLCVGTTSQNNTFKSQDELINFGWAEIALYGVFVVCVVAIILEYVLPLIDKCEKWLRIRFSYKSSFLITNLIGIAVFYLAFNFILDPSLASMSMATFGL